MCVEFPKTIALQPLLDHLPFCKPPTQGVASSRADEDSKLFLELLKLSRFPQVRMSLV